MSHRDQAHSSGGRTIHEEPGKTQCKGCKGRGGGGAAEDTPGGEPQTGGETEERGQGVCRARAGGREASGVAVTVCEGSLVVVRGTGAEGRLVFPFSESPQAGSQNGSHSIFFGSRFAAEAGLAFKVKGH